MTKVILFAVVILVSVSGCTDADREKMLTNWGKEFTIEMYSGGQLVRTWTSSGKVSTEQGSDGYFFKDKATGKLVEVSGDVVITNVN